MLPIIPVNARLTDGTSVKPAHTGKVPGTLTAAGTWSGLGGKWSDDLHATAALCIAWSKSGAGVGLQSRVFVGLDIDVDDPTLAAAIQSFAEDYLGLAPVRTRTGSARRLMMYRVEAPLRKVRQPFGEKQAVELLAKGQQFVVEGNHPSGGSYAWAGDHPCDIGAQNIPLVTAADIERFFPALAAFLAARGLPLGKTADPSAALTTGTRKSLDDPSLWAPSPGAVVALLIGWQPAELAHDDFIAVSAAIKAALGPAREDHYADYLGWAPGDRCTEDEATRKVWDSITDAQVGWDWLASRAGQGGAAAQTEFDDGAGEAAMGPAAPETHNVLESMLSRYVWAEVQACFYDLKTGLPLSPKNFNSRNVNVAQFGRTGIQSAESVFQNEPRALKVVSATYRPGAGPLVDEDMNGSTHRAVNLWRPSRMQPAPGPVTDADVKPWLDHISMLFGPAGDPAHEHILNYMAFVLQKPGEKINHAPVILSNTHGLGKDTAFVPFLAAVGHHNCASIRPEDLVAPFNPHVEKQVIIVNEMANFQKKEMANAMKPLLAAPPQYLLVNQKNVKQYHVPNLCNVVIFTNLDNAISIDEQDRRYWVWRCLTDNEGKQSDEYFLALHRWFGGGNEKDPAGSGSMLVARWLLDRDVSAFNPTRPPAMTEAKAEMIEGGLAAAIKWLDGEFAPGEAFHARKIIAAFELVDHAKHAFSSPSAPCKDMHAVSALKRAGYSSTSDKYRLESGKVVRLWSLKPLANNAPAVLKAYEADVKNAPQARA